MEELRGMWFPMRHALRSGEGAGRYVLWDGIVWILALILVLFLLVTMGIRSHAARLEDQCKERLLALAQAEQMYLERHTKFTSDLEALRPYLEPGKRRMPMVCPITGHAFLARVQGPEYKIVAPGTDFFIKTGDPSW